MEGRGWEEGRSRHKRQVTKATCEEVEERDITALNDNFHNDLIPKLSNG
jgi:hypothetical protein